MHLPVVERLAARLGLTSVTLLATSGLVVTGIAGTVAGLVVRHRRLASSSSRSRSNRTTQRPDSSPQLTEVYSKPVIGGGGAAEMCHGDEETMRKGGLFTCFFNRDTEVQVLSLLQAYKNDHGISSCKPVTGTLMDGEWPVEYRKYFRQAEQATREILTQMYPSGAPWDGDQFAAIRTAQEAEEGGPLLGSVFLWRWWLWKRVNALAEAAVCEWRPIT